MHKHFSSLCLCQVCYCPTGPSKLHVQAQIQERSSSSYSWEELQIIYIHFWQSTTDIKNERVTCSPFCYKCCKRAQNAHFLLTVINYILCVFFLLSKLVYIIFGRNSRALVVYRILRMLVIIYSMQDKLGCTACALHDLRDAIHTIFFVIFHIYFNNLLANNS